MIRNESKFWGKFLFSLLFFTAIAWLWIGHMIAADGTLVNSAGTTTVGGSASAGNYLTNNQSTAITFSNTFTVDATHRFQVGAVGISNQTISAVPTIASVKTSDGGPAHVSADRMFANVYIMDTGNATHTEAGRMSSDGSTVSFVNFTTPIGINVSNITARGWIAINTNTLAQWPTVAPSQGGAVFVNSNATVYIITSTPGSTTWAATNKIAGP